MLHRVKTWRLVCIFCLKSIRHFAEGHGPNATAQSFQRIYLASLQTTFHMVGGRKEISLHLLLSGWLPISIARKTTLSKAAFWRKQRPDWHQFRIYILGFLCCLGTDFGVIVCVCVHVCARGFLCWLSLKRA